MRGGGAAETPDVLCEALHALDDLLFEDVFALGAADVVLVFGFAEVLHEGDEDGAETGGGLDELRLEKLFFGAAEEGASDDC